MKLIIEVEKDYYEMIKYNVEHGQEYKPFEIIANGIPYEATQGDIHDFIAKADEGTLFQLKKEIENALTKIIEREAYEEARREAMKLDEADGTLKGRGFA